jgi:hypothetical protein
MYPVMLLVSFGLGVCMAVAGVLALPAAASANTSVSTTSLNLGSELVGTTSGSQPVTVTVSCTTTFGVVCTTQGQFDAAASGGSSGITGPAAGDFSQTNNCPVGTLNGGLAGNTGSCQFNVSFTPSAAGTQTRPWTWGQRLGRRYTAKPCVPDRHRVPQPPVLPGCALARPPHRKPRRGASKVQENSPRSQAPVHQEEGEKQPV